MLGTLVPSPDRRRPDLVASLPYLRTKLERERRYRLDEITQLNDDDQAAARNALGDIETALYRMHTGRYGRCIYCLSEIPLEDLYASPQADACAECGRDQGTA
jgi:RNA polymerase-binding transcription factor DksA